MSYNKTTKRTLLWHFWSRKMLASCPWLRISRRVCWDWPVTWAKVSPSAIVAMKLPWTMFTISIILAALPTSPGSKIQHWTFLQNRCSSLAPPPHAVLTLLRFPYWSQTLYRCPFSLQALENLAVSHALEQREKLKYHLKIRSTTDSPKWDNIQKWKLSLKALKLAEFQRSGLVSHTAYGDRKQPIPLANSLQRWYMCLSDSFLNIPVLALTKNLLSNPWYFSYLEKKRSSPSLGNSYCSPHINPCHQLPGSQAFHH